MAYSNIFFAKHYNPATTQLEIIDFATEWESRFALPALPDPIIKSEGKTATRWLNLIRV
ncbi:hypothetical protein HSBAA_56540 [Vreelandella sulfidaeris]|uniref:Uncharacterized protein n=1 Tax=Vreelandella sulfidaeris TaxID=115553 RepID=A0A455UJ16_9GAMM|nr:hypothetical protein HSBAA_56540 [Halomonas sulfidaeris]